MRHFNYYRTQKKKLLESATMPNSNNDPTFLVLLQLGFLPTDTGPYVTELREVIRRKMADGMTSMHVSWGPGAFDITKSGGSGAERRARELLACEWEKTHGSYADSTWARIENIDSLIQKKHNLKTGKTSWRINRPGAWVRDRIRILAAALLRFWRRDIRRLKNPYK